MTRDDIAKKFFNDYANRLGCWLPLFAFLLAIALILCTSCKTKTKIEYVDKEVVKYEYKIKHDTLIENNHDSIFHTIFQKGDTVYNVKYKEKIKYKDKFVYTTDTLYKDSIQYVDRKETVEKKYIPKWCYYSLVGWILLLIFAIYKIYKWLR